MCLTFSLCADVCCLCFWMSNLFYFVNHGLYACLTVVFPLWLSVSPLGVLPVLCCCEYLKLLSPAVLPVFVWFFGFFYFDCLPAVSDSLCIVSFESTNAVNLLLPEPAASCLLHVRPCLFKVRHVHVVVQDISMHHKHIDVEILRSLIWWRH